MKGRLALLKSRMADMYWRLPESTKDLLGGLLRRVPRFQVRPSRDEIRYFRQLQESQWYPADRLGEIQAQRLQDLLRHCQDTVPYYRRLFADHRWSAEDFRHPADLAKLPLLTKDMIRQNPGDFISEKFAPQDLAEISTGGSTGTPMRFFFDQAMQGVRRAHWWRWSEFAGVDLYSDRMVYCGGTPREGGRGTVSHRAVISPTRDRMHLGTTGMSDKVLDRFADEVVDFGADYLRGYASGCFLLARRLLERGKSLKLKAVLTSSDTLYPQYRETMEKAFGCGVFDHYGQNEDSLTATECGAGEGLHINVESCLPETVDAEGQPLEGAFGRLVSTHLMNRAMPLVRYVVGDLGQLGDFDSHCACGRHLQKLIRLDGRDDEIIVTPEGARVGCGSMNQPMKKLKGQLGACQYIQESPDRLVLKVTRGPDWQGDQVCSLLAREVSEHLGSAMTVAVEVVDQIPTRPNGKFQFIVKNF